MMRSGVLAVLILLLPLTGVQAVVGPVYESFEDGFGGWEIDHDIYCAHDPEPCSWEWDAFRAPGLAYDGAWGVAILQEGSNDSGTVWLEREIFVPSGERVELAFWVFSPYLAPTTAWDVRAYIGLTDPDSEWDLERVGQLDHLPGWHRYCLAKPAPETETMWVAAGTRAAWESGLRLHAIDHISVRGATGGEPCGLLEDPCHVAGTPCTVQRMLCDYTACPQS